MARRLCALVLFVLLAVLPGGCSAQPQKYSVSFWDTFDTVITLSGYARNQSAFDAVAARAHAEFQRLHAIFDKYQEHPGVNGLWALNHAGGEELRVADELWELISLCASQYEELGGRVNIALGGVLALWSECREAAALPPQDALRAAAGHADMEGVMLDARNNTVRLADPQTQLDLGACAKGYAVERVARLIADEMPSYLINGGGNVRAGAAPLDGRAGWTVGVTDPVKAYEDSTAVLLRLELSDLSVVTSGGYQRYYTVDGARYHHLIDPDTLYPCDRFLQTTALCEDSGMADLLSTALFLLPYEEGRALVERLDGVDAIWVFPDGRIQMTPGAQALAKSGA